MSARYAKSRIVHTEGVTGSIPVASTKLSSIISKPWYVIIPAEQLASSLRSGSIEPIEAFERCQAVEGAIGVWAVAAILADPGLAFLAVERYRQPAVIRDAYRVAYMNRAGERYSTHLPCDATVDDAKLFLVHLKLNA